MYADVNTIIRELHNAVMKSARYIIYFPIYIKRITKKLNIQRVGKQKYNCFNCTLEKRKKKKKLGRPQHFCIQFLKIATGQILLSF